MKILYKVLIVDDSPTMRQILMRELLAMEFSKINLTEATDGREAIQMALDKPFDLIIMDWNMPNILGIDAVRSIRGAGITAPILMVTTESEKLQVVKAIQAGANNYLVKPFTGQNFQEKIRGLLPDLPPPRPEDDLDSLIPNPEAHPMPQYQTNIGVDLEESKLYHQGDF